MTPTGPVLCRLAGPPDHPALARLFIEMQAHYAVFCPSEEAILARLAARPAGTDILLAEREGAALGFAAFCPLYPGPGLKPGVFLKELYVCDAARGGGIGRALMQALARETLARGLGRIDLTADADDARLLAFYDGLGGKALPKKLFYRLGAEELDWLASD